MKHDLCQVATAVLKPIERAMQPWINGPRRTRRTRLTRRTRPSQPTQRTPPVSPPMLDAFCGASLLGFSAATLACDGAVMRRSVEYDCPNRRCLSGTLVSSLKAECGSHTPWPALACPSTPWPMQVSKFVVSQGFMQDMAWIWCLHFLACRIVLYRHAVKSSQAERKQRSSVWTQTETFLSSRTMGRRWLLDAACGRKFGNRSVDYASQPVQQCICTKQDRTTHLQSFPMFADPLDTFWAH